MTRIAALATLATLAAVAALAAASFAGPAAAGATCVIWGPTFEGVPQGICLPV